MGSTPAETTSLNFTTESGVGQSKSAAPYFTHFFPPQSRFFKSVHSKTIMSSKWPRHITVHYTGGPFLVQKVCE